MDQGRLAGIRAALEEERSSLERQLTDLGVRPDSADVEVSVDEGFADSAQATAERSQQVSMVEQQKAVYAEVLAALKRLDEGTYGKCENCGQQIPIERLEALPSARLCLTCKQASSQ